MKFLKIFKAVRNGKDLACFLGVSRKQRFETMMSRRGLAHALKVEG